ncbi:MAG TPA: PEGA domain-containing protein [Blastocatellia bacterium]|nr:PEGA domain-containing protein [Blastocatellia bacterium]
MSLVTQFLTGRAGKYLLGGLLIAGFGCSTPGITFSQTTSTKPSAVSERQLDSDLKLLLNDYYAGKPVRAKVVIPANDRGIEVLDGQLKIYPQSEMTAAVQPGEMILIKELRFKNKEIEVRFNGEHLNEAANAESNAPALTPVGPHGSDASVPKSALVAKAAKPTKPLPDPRVILRFSRDIETRDLNLQSINRLLAPAVDVASLTPDAGLKPEATPAPRLSASDRAQQAALAQGIASATVTGDLVGAAANVGELIIECATPGARLYIDGAYSGTTPRTVQLTMGVHTVLIVAAGQGQFEQKFFLPAGKIATIKADLQQR